MSATPFCAAHFDQVYSKCVEEMRYSSIVNTRPAKLKTGMNGLINQGSSCFANCVLQVLMNTPQFITLYISRPLRPYINIHNRRGTQGTISGAFSALTDHIWDTNFNTVNPASFMKIVAMKMGSQFDGKNEEDAHEFQTLLLDRLSEDVNLITTPTHFQQDYNDISQIDLWAQRFMDNQQKFTHSIVNDIFKFVAVTTTMCTMCGSTRINFEELNHLSIALTGHDRVRDGGGILQNGEMTNKVTYAKGLGGSGESPEKIDPNNSIQQVDHVNPAGGQEESADEERRPPMKVVTHVSLQANPTESQEGNAYGGGRPPVEAVRPVSTRGAIPGGLGGSAERKTVRKNKNYFEHDVYKPLDDISPTNNDAESESEPPAEDGSVDGPGAGEVDEQALFLEDCLNQHFAEATVTARCSTCACDRLQTTAVAMWTSPTILVIHMKRFWYADSGIRKDSRYIDFRVDDLNVQFAMHPRQIKGKYGTLYSLYGIVVHRGDPNSGHYTARVKNLDRDAAEWHIFDDDNVHWVSVEKLTDCQAYMLYYARNGVSKAIRQEALDKIYGRRQQG